MVAEPKNSWSEQMGRYFGVALLLPVSTFVGYAIGYLLDRVFGTGFLKIIFLILGTVAGFLELIRQLGRDSRNGSP